MKKSQEQQRHSERDHPGKVIDRKDGFDIIECKHCGYMHIDPIPPEENLEKIYSDEYYTDEKPKYVDYHIEDREWWYLQYNDRYDLFEENLPDRHRRLVDVGSGPGLFLAAGAERGWETTGIEPSTRAATFARSLGGNVLNKPFQRVTDEEIPPGTVHVVHLAEVLEHLPDPAYVIRKSKEWMAPGGLIFIAVPNEYNPLQVAVRNHLDYSPYWLAPPHHINYFTPDSLAALLNREGFDVIDTSMQFPMEVFLLMGDNYVGNDEVGRKCHAKRKNLEIELHRSGLDDLRLKFGRAMAQVGVGRQILMLGRYNP